MDALSLAVAGASIVPFARRQAIDFIYERFSVSDLWEVRLDETQRIGAFVTLHHSVETAWIGQPVVVVYDDRPVEA